MNTIELKINAKFKTQGPNRRICKLLECPQARLTPNPGPSCCQAIVTSATLYHKLYLNIRKLGNKQQTWCYSIFEKVFALPHHSNSSPDIVQYYEWSVMSQEGKTFIIRRKNTSAIDHCKQMRR